VERLSPAWQYYVTMGIIGAGGAATQAVIAVLVGARYGTAAAGVVLGAGVLGRLAAAVLERRDAVSRVLTRLYVTMAGSLALIVTAAVGPWWATAVVSALAGVFPVLLMSSLMHRNHGSIPGGSSASMLAQAATFFVAGAAAGASDGALVAVAVATTGALALLRGVVDDEPASHAAADETSGDDTVGNGTARETTPGAAGSVAGEPGPGTLVWVAFPLLLGVVAYGPLQLFATLVTVGLGAGWVGPGFLVYALGSLVAGRVLATRRLGLVAVALLGAVGGAVWFIALSSWGALLVTRFVAGVVMFVAQGAMLQRAAEHGRASLASALVGVGVGAQLGAVWCGLLAESSIAAMAAVSVVASLGLAVATRAAAARAARVARA
jgi:hypothetical protein